MKISFLIELYLTKAVASNNINEAILADKTAFFIK